jgi:hypothetical protein
MAVSSGKGLIGHDIGVGIAQAAPALFH